MLFHRSTILILTLFLFSHKDLIETKSIFPSIKFLHEKIKAAFEIQRIVACTEAVIISQDVNSKYDPVLLYEHPFRGVIGSFDFDFHFRLLFISVYNAIYRKNLNNNKVEKIYPKNGTTFPDFEIVQLSVDWLNNDLYFLADMASYKEFKIIKINYNGLNEEIVISKNHNRIEHFEVDPYNGFMFWTNSLGFHRVHLNNIKRGKKILYHEYLLGAFTIDHIAYRAFIVHNENNYIVSVSLDGSESVVIRTNVVRPAFTNTPSLALINGSFYFTDSTEVIKEEYDNFTDKYYHNQLFFNCKSCFIFNYVVAYSYKRQPIPFPLEPPINITVTNLTKNSIELSWKEPALEVGKSNMAWRKYLYKIQYKNLNSMQVFVASNINTTNTVLTKLNENCTYLIKAAAYSSSGQSSWSTEMYVTTYDHETEKNLKDTRNQSNELRPVNIEFEHITPNLVKIKWLPPIKSKYESVWYELNWKTEEAVLARKPKNKKVIKDNFTYENKFLVSNISLLSNQLYYVWIKAYGSKTGAQGYSKSIRIRTLPEPNNLELVTRTNTTLILKWIKHRAIVDYDIELHTKYEWTSIKNTSSINTTNEITLIKVSNLSPYTQFKFRLKLWYQNDLYYIWPKDEMYFTFGTLPGAPSKTRQPFVKVDDQSVYVNWLEPNPNGDPILHYVVEGIDKSKLPYEMHFVTFCNTYQLFCKIDNLARDGRFIFRVKAYNSNGYGEFSKFSEEIGFEEQIKKPEPITSNKTYYLALVIILVFGIFFITFLISILFIKSHNNSGPVQYSKTLVNNCSNRNSTTISIEEVDADILNINVHENSFLESQRFFYSYLPSPSPSDINKLPQFSPNDFTLTKLMGRGAFGEVYIGKTSTDQKIAIKTLRSDCDMAQREYFLKEAILMHDFCHKNVLKLIGVCVCDEKNYILMELMENGDLLSFLRKSRVRDNTKQALLSYITTLSVIDLVTICVQISLGCEYLERKKYVHRDLACRNCLIAVRGNNIVVKIADFGLTRYIQNKDYYRVDTVTCLPIRWMAPESLIYNIFTTKSDVWSFGIVMWEIFTIGEQPYGELSSAEVIDFVKDHSIMKPPSYSPIGIYSLMKRCWQYDHKIRVDFNYCVNELRRIKRLCIEPTYVNVNEIQNEYLGIEPSYDNNTNNNECNGVKCVENKLYIDKASHRPKTTRSRLKMSLTLPIIAEE